MKNQAKDKVLSKDVSLYGTLEDAVNALHRGQIVAYPTEGVYGLGCDPLNADAVHQLRLCKSRSTHKSFILVACNWDQVSHWTLPVPPQCLNNALSSWPGPITWVFPASHQLPEWLQSQQSTIALRITAHPTVRDLCQYFNGPIISTSANLSGEPPALNARDVAKRFKTCLSCIIDAPLGNLAGAPTTIKEIMTGNVIRA